MKVNTPMCIIQRFDSELKPKIELDMIFQLNIGVSTLQEINMHQHSTNERH